MSAQITLDGRAVQQPVAWMAAGTPYRFHADALAAHRTIGDTPAPVPLIAAGARHRRRPPSRWPAGCRAMAAAADKARQFPTNTCGASRHVQLIAEQLLEYGALSGADPDHVAESLLATVAALWAARTELAALQARSP
jgi:hypothetical protein